MHLKIHFYFRRPHVFNEVSEQRSCQTSNAEFSKLPEYIIANYGILQFRWYANCQWV